MLGLLLIAGGLAARAQVEVRAYVVDSVTAEPLAFASVYNARTGSGTAAKEDGLVILPDNRVGDTLVVSYVGYRTARLPLSGSPPSTIALAPLAAELSEVVVLADDDYLYDILRQARRKRFTPSRRAKTYFFLETEVAGQLAEVIEAYYTGTYEDHATRELTFKKGRIGQHAVGEGYFTSTSTSRLFTSFDVFAESLLFPLNPLAMSRRAAKRRFDVQLEGRYREGERDVYAIAFTPKWGEDSAFAGRAWIDRATGQLLRVQLRIPDAERYPFTPLGGYLLGKVGMVLELTFAEVDGVMTPERISADYLIEYRDVDRPPFAVRTKTFTRAYAYGEAFAPPHFSHGPETADYRNVSRSPYDSLFWADTREFRFYDRLAEIERFVRTSTALDYRVVDLTPGAPPNSFLDSRYITWDRERVRFASDETRVRDSVPTQPELSGLQRPQLGLRLYADVYDLPDGPHVLTAAAIDPRVADFAYAVEPAVEAFLNLRFDLLEIERRRLAEAIARLPEPKHRDVARLRQNSADAYNRLAERFASEADGGADLQALKLWSRRVWRELGIDNYEVFGLEALE